MLMIVNNMPRSRSDGGFSDWPMNNTPQKCASFFCMAPAKVYSDVIIDGKPEKGYFRVAFCGACSRKDDTFLVWQHALIEDKLGKEV